MRVRAVVVLFLGVVLAACQGSASEAPAADGPVAFDEREDAPEQLPTLTLDEFGGDGQVDVAEFTGGPLIVNFWATWCAPCTAEMPDFQTLHRQAGERLTILGVNTQDAPPNAQEFVAELGITYDLVADPQGEFYNAVNGFGMPTTLFVAPDRSVEWRHTGPLTLDQMRDLTAQHLGVELSP